MKPDTIRVGLFRDRREAGRLLAAKLANYADRRDVVVLALPRSGVPVAYEVASALDLPLDVFVVRKLGIPGYDELAMGAVATAGVRVLNDQLVTRLGVPERVIEAVAAREQQELARRERLYRGGRPPPDVRGRTVILVDDGLATGATMHAAIAALRQLQPARIVVAVPTASPEICEEIREKVDDVICAITPEPFHAVGIWYQDFSQTTDEEVHDLLAQRNTSKNAETVQSPADSAVGAVAPSGFGLPRSPTNPPRVKLYEFSKRRSGMKTTIKAKSASLIAVAFLASMIAAATPVAAQWRGPAVWEPRPGPWHGPAWRPGPWPGPGWAWRPGYWNGGVWYNGWWAPAVVAGAAAGVAAGAIIASSPAANCWQNRPVYDVYGRWLGNRTVNVCR